jgi:hypothetical protein
LFRFPSLNGKFLLFEQFGMNQRRRGQGAAKARSRKMFFGGDFARRRTDQNLTGRFAVPAVNPPGVGRVRVVSFGFAQGAVNFASGEMVVNAADENANLLMPAPIFLKCSSASNDSLTCATSKPQARVKRSASVWALNLPISAWQKLLRGMLLALHAVRVNDDEFRRFSAQIEFIGEPRDRVSRERNPCRPRRRDKT